MALLVKGLAVKVKNKTLVQDVGFNMESGRWLSILGKNGSGKTTLLRAMCGLLDSTMKVTGSIQSDDVDLFKASTAKKAQTLAYVATPILSSFPIRVDDFVALGRYQPSATGAGTFESLHKDDKALLQDLSTELGVVHLFDENYQHLSLGQKQLVCLMQALASGPKVLILDECLFHLDLANRKRTVQFLKDLCSAGLTVISASHDLNQAAADSDFIMLLKSGRMAAFGDVDDVFTPQHISETFDLSDSQVIPSLTTGRPMLSDYSIQ